MSTNTRVFLAVLVGGMILWAAILTAPPRNLPLTSPFVPLFAFVVGLLLAIVTCDWAAGKNPGGWLAKGSLVPQSTRSIIFGIGFAIGLLYFFAAH